MTQDDLETPLRPPAKAKASFAARFDGVVILASALAAIFLLGAVWSMIVTDPFGGEPTATAAIERRLPARPAGEAAAPHPEGHAPAPTVAGVSRDGVPVVRPGDAMPKGGPVIIRIPGADDAAPGQPGRAPAGEVDAALLEDSRYGPLPRIGADGRRPLDIYARPVKAAPRAARVALVVGGLGVGREATLDAIGKLPVEVSLAFSPYGTELADFVGKARKGGHEVLLQAPMEPFDYPANDPGPQTLLTSLPASANLERLRWALGRVSGYVGVAALGGGRFIESDEAVAPVFAELARRGLMFVGDGGGKAGGGRAATQAGLPHAQPSLVIDAVPEADAIDAELARLERMAKEGKVAVGWAGASPLTLKRIEAWRAGLAERGVALAPISAAGGPEGPS